MYLCDKMKAISDCLDDNVGFMQQSAFLRWMRGKMIDVLENADLYIFERSALSAAGALRMGDPDRIDAMLEAVLDEPRRIFVECSYRQRQDEMFSLHGHIRERVPEGRFEPQRVGLDIEILAPGKARIQPYWCFPKHMVEGLPPEAGANRLVREASAALMTMGISFGFIEVDISKGERISLEQFRKKVAAGGIDPAIERSARVVLGPGEHGDEDLLNAAWREFRLNIHSGYGFDETARAAVVENVMASGQDVEEVITASQRDLDGELIFAIAMLAVIRARRDSEAFDLSERPARPRRAVKRPRLQDMGLPKVSIMSLTPSRGRAGSGPGVQRKGSKRVRHAVRGHLFLARNGRMVFRRPHFRGSLEAPRARRVK